MTNLVPRRPLRPIADDFNSLRRTMDRVLNGAFDVHAARAPRPLALGGSPYGSDIATLPLDISEQDGDIVVRAVVLGFARDDIDVQVDGGVLSITARRSEEGDDEQEC